MKLIITAIFLFLTINFSLAQETITIENNSITLVTLELKSSLISSGNCTGNTIQIITLQPNSTTTIDPPNGFRINEAKIYSPLCAFGSGDEINISRSNDDCPSFLFPKIGTEIFCTAFGPVFVTAQWQVGPLNDQDLIRIF